MKYFFINEISNLKTKGYLFHGTLTELFLLLCTADVKDANAQQQMETKTDSSEEEEVIPDRRNKYRLDNIKLDVKGLMKGAAKHTVKKQPTRKTDPSPARSDHTHAKPEEQILTPVSRI